MVRSALLIAAALRVAAKEDTGSLLQVAHVVELEEQAGASEQFLPSFMQCLAECLPSASSGAEKSNVEQFENEHIHQTLPLPSADLHYPPQLEGIIWMDQAGFLGHSDVPSAAAAPDGCFSFGDSQFSTLQSNADNTMATINVDTSGPAWQWFNNAKGYLFYKTLSKKNFHYHFQFTDNYKHAQIFGTAQPPMIPGFSPPPGFLNFTMDYQSAYLDENLCPRTASQEVLACVGVDMDIDDVQGVNCARVRREITRCAKWKRVSSVLGGESTYYYAYEIVDRNGNKQQPYFDMYLKWVNKNTNPSSLAAYALGLNGIAEKQETSFRGIRKETGDQLENSGNDIFGACGKCINPAGLPMLTTANGIGIDYIRDMLSLKGVDYTDSWCDGQIAGCAEKNGFPGQRVTSIMGHEAVTNLTRLTPEKEWTGEWWRGGELGFIINNPIFWMGAGINPPAIGLGSTPKQHAVVRPHVEKVFELEKWKRADRAEAFKTVDRMVHDFLEKKKTAGEESDRKISVPTDMTILVHQILNKVSLQRDVTWEYAADFVALQSSVVGLGTISQLLPSALYQNCHPMNVVCVKVRDHLEGIQKRVVKFVDEYERVLRDMGLEPELKPQDAECLPSDSCMRQLAVATWDALYAAGGLSVPTQMAVGLGILFSEDESNPFRDNKHTFKPEDNAMQFALELVRYFPPVVGFPHWEVRPTCVGLSAEETAGLAAPDGATKACPWDKDGRDDKPNLVNQYQGGTRVVPNLALAQRDPAVWGSNSEKFVIRSHAEYVKSVGFAEPAYRPEFLNGAMNRNCPGKTLALHIVSSFFKQLKQEEWYADGEGPKITSGPGFVEAFELKHSSWKAAEYDAARVWIPTPDFSGKAAMDREFVPTYPQETFASMPMAKNGVSIESINGVEYAVFPMDQQYKDIVGVRSTHTEGTSTHEFGDLRWMADFQDPEFSPIPNSVVAFVEKFFTYEHDGPWHPTEEAKTAEEARQEPTEVTNGAVERAAKVLKFLDESSLDSIRLAAAFDPLAAADLMFYVDYRQPRPSAEDRSKVHAMKARLNQGRARVSAMPKGTAPESVSTSCVHFLDHPSMIRDEENMVVKFPLSRNLPAFRGQSVFSPRYHVSMTLGHGFFDVTEDGKNLVWYHGASSYGSWETKRENMGTSSARYTYRVPPKLYISEAGGAGLPSPAQAMDLRATEHNPADARGRLVKFQDDMVDKTDHRHQLFLKYATLPMSYTFLYPENAEAVCAPHLEHAASRLQHSDWRTLAKEGLTVEEGHAFEAGIFEALVCGQSLLRGAADYSSGVDSAEMFVFQHFMMEWPASRRLHAARGDRHLYDGWHWEHHHVFGEAAPLEDDVKKPC